MATSENAAGRPRLLPGGAALRPFRMLLVALLAMVLAACSNPPVGRPSPTPTPTATASHAQPHDLLAPGMAEEVVERLVQAADGRPIVRVIIDRTRAHLTYLGEGDRPASFTWLAGVVSPSDDGTDLALDATSFDPNRFNLSNIAALFQVAGMIAESTSRQQLQITEYDHGQVYMSVTTSPESTTVFFDQDGILIPQLDLTADADIAEGIDAVLDGRVFVVELGFSETEQVWADVLAGAGVLERRIRPLRRPMYLAQRRESPGTQLFDATQLDVAALGRLLRGATIMLEQPPDTPVVIRITQPADAPAPLITIEAGGSQLVTDLSGEPAEDD
ncbi:MAG: hypothetical protein ACOX61_07100 [Brooklawnia sp.]